MRKFHPDEITIGILIVKTIRNDTRVKNSVLTPDGVTEKRYHTKCDKKKECYDNNHEQSIIIKRRLHKCGIMNLIIQAHFKNFPGWDTIFIKILILKKTTRIMITSKMKTETFIFWIRKLFNFTFNFVKTK